MLGEVQRGRVRHDDANHDRFVWTDDDFGRGDDWLESLVEAGEANGPSTMIPFFQGTGWWRIYEPWVLLTATFSFYTGFGPWSGNAWGGGVTFTREDVEINELVDDLRRSLSDDAVLSQQLGSVHPARFMKAHIDVSGGLRSVKERIIRYIRLTHVHEGATSTLLIFTLLSVAGIYFPVATGVSVTLAMAAVYFVLGFRRWTFLLAFPTLFLGPATISAALYVDEFVWVGRRYRLNGPLDVEVVDEG